MTRMQSTLAGLLAGLIGASAGMAGSLVPALTQIEAQGYEILEVDARGSEIEIEAIRADGARVDLLVAASTGAIISETLDD